MLINIDQHIFGKTKEKDFSSLDCSFDISKEDLRLIEKYSLFQLPNELLYNEDAVKPKKYVYYRVNNEYIVIGRGIDTGRDEFGRIGNFIFSNIILNLQEIEAIKINPVELLLYLEDNGIFKNEFLEGERLSSRQLEIDLLNKSQKENRALLEKDQELLALLLYAIFNSNEIISPICLNGSEDKIICFMSEIFSYFPQRMWWNVSFNTYWYDDAKLPGLFFCCTDAKTSNKRFPSHAITIDLERGIHESKLNIKNNKKFAYANFVARTSVNNKNLVEKIHLLEEFIVTNDWMNFIDAYRETPQDMKEIIYEEYKENILKRILIGFFELLSAVNEFLTKEDWMMILKSKKFIHQLIVNHNDDIAKEFTNAFYDMPHSEDKFNICKYYITHLWLLDILIVRIKEEKATYKNMEVMKLLYYYLIKQYEEQGRINENVEAKLLVAFVDLLQNMTNFNTDDILKVIKKSPKSNNNVKVVFLKALIKYRSGDSGDLISIMKSEQNQLLITELLNEGIKAINWNKYPLYKLEKKSKLNISIFK